MIDITAFSVYTSIPLTKGMRALIDLSDYPRVTKYKWQVVVAGTERHPHYYAASFINGKTTRLHRFLLNLPPNAPEVDHKNGNGLDCRRQNLRIATRQQNCQNTSKPRLKRGATSRYKGVSWQKSATGGFWRPRICVGGKNLSLGAFRSEIEAARAYDKAAKEHYGVFANVNFC